MGSGVEKSALRLGAWIRRPLPRPARPLVIAHRGASAEAPENTMTAFRLAKIQGADAIELDVHRCQSGELVVIHDPDLLRMTGVEGRVSEWPLSKLKTLRVAGEAIPTLEEVLTDPAVPHLVNIEVKSDQWTGDGAERALRSLIRRLGAHSRVLISSFNPLVLARLELLDPRMPRGLLYANDLKQSYLRRPYLAPLVRPHLLHPHHALVDATLVQEAHAHGYWLMVWTVDDPEEQARLLTLGVDGIITNRPGALRDLMAG